MDKHQRPIVCILAYNEEARIANVITRILEGNRDSRPLVRVYANGCTDRTHEIVGKIAASHPDVELMEIARASKPNAWNRAFRENANDILIFADADVVPEEGAVSAILHAFENNPKAEIACCESWPEFRGASLQQKLTGLMQIPVNQDFLIGHFYGIRRTAFERYFAELGLTGLPEGIAGDDAFIDQLVPRDRFVLVDKKVKYQPPTFEDYFRYLGRIRWQNEQIRQYNERQQRQHNAKAPTGRLTSLQDKLKTSRHPTRLLIGAITTALRLIFKALYKNRIEAAYRQIGPVQTDGAWVLSQATRSSSVK